MRFLINKDILFSFEDERHFEIAKVYQEIYPKRESENSQRGFRFERTRRLIQELYQKFLKQYENKRNLQISN
jgi:hypothetical protein